MSDPGRGRAQQGHKRVLRGGSWINNGRNLRSANRNGNEPDERNDNIGLRLAGALGAGGSINQCPVPFRWSLIDGQSPGPRCVSRPSAESLPVGRLFFRGSP
ncbi:MAG: SUMF1/EgtB/PvdO family nonheme iron enzyme [Sedimenticola sp.]